MKLLQKFSAAIGVVLLFFAITGIGHMEWSSESGFSSEVNPPLNRLMALILGAVFLWWYFGMKKRSKLGLRLTSVLFYIVIGQFVWQGCRIAAASTSVIDAIWGIVSQVGIGALLFFILQRIKKSWRDSEDKSEMETMENGKGGPPSSS
jgi:hypothetical protein